MNTPTVISKFFSASRTLLSQRTHNLWTRHSKRGLYVLLRRPARLIAVVPLRLLAKMSGAGILLTVGFGSTHLMASSAAVVASSETEATVELPEVLRVVDELYNSNKIEEALRYLEVFSCSNEAEVLWRLGRLSYKVGKYHSSKSEASKMAEKAVHYAERALKADDRNFSCHKWMGIILSWSSEFEGTRKKIEKSFEIREKFMRAIELNQEDPTSRHLLGQWCYSVANVPWYQKKIASAIFATPPYSTYEEALSHFEAAEKVQPGFYSTNWLFIGRCHLQLGRVQEGGEWLKKTAAYTCQNDEDVTAKQQAEELIKKLGLN